jgi:sensor c-di-GMP phosphodiesterase-like protein
MSHFIERRNLVSRLIVIATAACGIAAGCLLGGGLALWQAFHWLESYSQTATTRNNSALAEARRVLHDMVIMPGFCSDTEIVGFRAMVFRSEYVKDAGRMQGGMIVCSATSGRPARAIGPFKPEFREQDGTFAYRSLAPAQNSVTRREALRLGNAYVVFGIELPVAPEPIPIQMSVTMKTGDHPDPQSGAAQPVPGNVFSRTTQGSGRVGKALYVTRCSEHNFNCMTASTTVPQALRSQLGIIAAGAVAGGLAGILMGMGFAFLYLRNREVSRQLRRAVMRDELRVLYQPIVNLETREIVGAEALARWTDEDGNDVDPEVFVKMAEDLGFVGSITKTVLQRVLRDFGPTLQSRPNFRMSINLAAADLVDPQFLFMLSDSMQRAQVRPESLVMEITERSAANSDAAMETIRNLRRMGHSIHIDDFGSGHSNLDKLLYLFADTIKIDKAFTKIIGTESVAAVILPQIISIAKSLNLEVVVEGVECTQQADYFSPSEQRIYAQGWLYGRPMSVESLLLELAGNPVLAPEEYGAFTTKPGTLRVVSSVAA